MEPLFRINPQLDPDQLNARYRAKRRPHISDFLVLEHAERLLQFLKNSTAWHLVLNAQLPPRLQREVASDIRALAIMPDLSED